MDPRLLGDDVPEGMPVDADLLDPQPRPRTIPGQGFYGNDMRLKMRTNASVTPVATGVQRVYGI